jgi:hypothetical protein
MVLTGLHLSCRLLYMRSDGPTGKGLQMSAYGSRKVGENIAGIGTIEQVSMTAYRVGQTWIPFVKVDQVTSVERLVVLDWSRA